MAGVHEILVDFIRRHEHAVAQADFRQSFKFAARPHAPDRVVRAAKNEQFYVVFHDFSLEVLEIDMVLNPVEAQLVHNGLASVVTDGSSEAVIDRFLDEDCVPRFREASNQGAEGKHDARSGRHED